MIDLETAALLSSLFVVAILYSSVGHGGASGYLAVMALFSIPAVFTRPTALILNVIVSSIATFSFWKAGHFEKRLFIPIAILAVPLAFLGGFIELPKQVYQNILGIGLLLAAFRLAWKFSVVQEEKKPNNFILVILGAAIGLVSGLIGIGGGVFLTPILLIMHWANAQRAAAVSAAFILLNSLAGLFGMYSKEIDLPTNAMLWISVAILGGIIGSQLGSKHLDSLALRRILAGVLVIAALKLIIV
jgi:uncharacterized protein